MSTIINRIYELHNKMGNKLPKVYKSKQDRAVASENRTNATNKAKEKVQNAQNYLVGELYPYNKSSGEVALSNENIAKAIAITETAKHQLDRNGNNLTKADLIAIVTALQAGNNTDIEYLEKNTTIKDLNTMIRTIVYDPARYISLPDRLQNGSERLALTNLNENEHKNKNVLMLTL